MRRTAWDDEGEGQAKRTVAATLSLHRNIFHPFCKRQEAFLRRSWMLLLFT